MITLSFVWNGMLFILGFSPVLKIAMGDLNLLKSFSLWRMVDRSRPLFCCFGFACMERVAFLFVSFVHVLYVHIYRAKVISARHPTA